MKYVIFFFGLLSGIYAIKKPIISFLILSSIISYLIFQKKYQKLYYLLSFFIGCLLYILFVIIIKRSSWYGIVVVSKDNYFIFRTLFSRYYVPVKNNPYEVFDIIHLQGNLSNYHFLNYESQFNFEKYLENQFVYQEIDDIKIKSIILTPLKIRKWTNDCFNQYDTISKNVLSKLLFNKSLDSEYNELIDSTGMFYVFSISSFHIYAFNKISKKIIEMRFSEKISNIITFLNTILFLLFSNYKITIIKLLIFYAIKKFTEKRKGKWTFIERIFFSNSIFICLFPFFVFQSSFLLNFSLPIFFYYSRDSLSTFKKKKRKYGQMVYLFLFMIPILIYQNGYFSLLAIFWTEFCFPVVFFVFLSGILGLVLNIPFYINRICHYVYFLLQIIDKLSIDIYIGNVGIIFVIIYEIILFFFIYHLENKNRKYSLYHLIILIYFLLLASLPVQNTFSTEVDFINVGQGDSILIRDHLNTILVDTGGVKSNDLAINTLIPFLKKKRIYYLNYVFLTHQDYDHAGAFISLKNHFKILGSNQNNDFTQLTVGNITFRNLNPSSNNEENDDSLVLYFTLQNINFLLMGDASSTIEKKIIINFPDLKVDYLKLGHHGSKSSSSEEFIHFLLPKEAIISCGTNNYYGHPDKEVISILQKYSIKIRRTDYEGTIRYSF